MKATFTIIDASWERDSRDLLDVRHEVFVNEQNVPEEIEVDDDDADSWHFLARTQIGQPIGTARLLPSGQIGRVAVLASWRRSGVGTALMKAALAKAEQQKLECVSLHAQVDSIPFYQSLGFTVQGPVYEEAGIPHRDMSLSAKLDGP